MNKLIHFFSCFFIIFSISSCSTFQDIGDFFSFSSESEELEPIHFSSMGLYLERASTKQIDFEQYKVLPENVFFECGVIKHKENIPLEQLPTRISNESYQELAIKLTDFIDTLQSHKANFAPAAKGHSMADPGELTLSFSISNKDYRLSTSVDSIAEPNSLPAIKLKHLVRAIRHTIGNSPCGLKEFYGLGNGNN